MALARLVGSFLEDSPAAFRRLILPLYGLALPQLAILVWFVAAPEFRFLSTASEAWLIVALALGLVQAGAALWAFSYSRRLSAHLNVLQRDMNDIELIAAPDGRIEYANTRAEEAYGYTAAELMSMRITDLQRGDPEVARRQMETLRVDGSLVFEALHYRRDGSSFPVEVSSRLFTTDGQTRTHSLIRDISNRRSAEAALRQSEARYRNLVANASLPLAVVSIATNRVLFANDKTIALFELDAAQLTRYQAADFWLNPDDGTRFRDTIQRDGHVAGFEMRTRGLRGTDRWLTVSANVIEFEGERATLNIFTDITATMEAKERLAEAERFARGTVDALPGSLAVLDEHGVILSVNEPWREFARSSGTQPAAMGVGLNYLQVCDASSTLGEPDGRRFGDGLRAVMSGQLDTFSMEYECTAPATDRWMMARVTRFPGAGPLRIVVIHDDITARKRAEAGILATRQHYEALLNTATDGIHVVAPDGHLVEASPSFYRMLGYPDDPAPRLHITDWDAQWTQSELLERVAFLIDHPASFETVHRRRDGRRLDVEVSARGISIDGHRYLYASSRDITARKEAERALAGEHQRLDRILEGTNVGTWEWNVQTGEATFNERWLDIVGYRREDLTPLSIQTWEHLAHPDDLKRSTEQLEAHFRGEVPFYEMESRMRHKDGHWVWVLDRGKVATRTPEGQPLLMTGTHQDISERKATEAELQEAHQRFEKIFRHNPALMAISSMPNRRFVDINEAFLRTLGYSREEVIGRTSAELGLTPTPDRHTKITSTLEHAGHIEGREMPVRCKDGSVLTGVFSGELLTVQDRKELLTVMIDVTEQQKAEAAVRELAERADAANRAKSDFLANMSHELRTPMNGIIGMAGLLLDSNLDTEQRRHADALRHSGESLLTLINDILDISKIESGRFELEAVDFELAKVMADCRELLSDRLQRKSLTCDCVIADDVPPRLRGDAGRLRQIVLNLLDNGVKFTEHGSVDARISVERRTTDRVVLRCAVRDTGIGIPADKMPLLFQTFSQGDASISRRFGGTGLGLAISKQLAERMGGDIGVRSETGRGSEFWFTVEMGIAPALAREAPESASAAPPTFDGRKARILVAEDNATNQLVALGLLRKMGLSADAVADGAEAVRAVATMPYDLVLMDVQMPDVDGLEATRQIRAAESGGRRIPIIAMTAHAMQGDRERCLASGMDDYLAKPVSPQQLGDTLRQWLPAHTDVAGIQRAQAARTDAQDGAARIFDRDGMLNRVLDDEDAARFVARSFLEDLPKRIDALGELLAAGTLEDAERQAHTIKGAAATIGGESMRTVALGIERAARDGNLAAAQHLHRALHDEFEKLRSALQSAFTL